MSKTNNNELKDKIMKGIEGGQITMRPKAYFVFGTALLTLGFVGVASLSAYFVNIFLFQYRMFQPLGFLGLGSRGLAAFISTFPWAVGLLSILLLTGSFILLKKYEFSYRHKLAALSVALIISVLLFGFGLNNLGVNDSLSRAPGTRMFYNRNFSGANWIIGTISEVSAGLLVVTTQDGSTYEVMYDDTTHLPFGSDFEVGDTVRVVGKTEDGTFYAEGIGKPGRGMFGGTPGQRRFDGTVGPGRPMGSMEEPGSGSAPGRKFLKEN